MHNAAYWHNEGTRKVFTHPFCGKWLAALNREASVLDCGCGYGRLTPELSALGFDKLYGYDCSVPLIERARKENPGALYTNNIDDLLTKHFDIIICFALFTSCPAPNDQERLVSLINSVSNEKTLLYISDCEIEDNPQYHDRYEQRKLGIYGCFTSGSGIFRHHDAGHFDNLFSLWRRCEEKTVSGTTLHGNTVVIHQYLYEKEQSCC